MSKNGAERCCSCCSCCCYCVGLAPAGSLGPGSRERSSGPVLAGTTRFAHQILSDSMKIEQPACFSTSLPPPYSLLSMLGLAFLVPRVDDLSHRVFVVVSSSRRVVESVTRHRFPRPPVSLGFAADSPLFDISAIYCGAT